MMKKMFTNYLVLALSDLLVIQAQFVFARLLVGISGKGTYTSSFSARYWYDQLKMSSVLLNFLF